jgi:hypothetical protein
MAPQTHREKGVFRKTGQVRGIPRPLVPEGSPQQASRDPVRAFARKPFNRFHQGYDFFVIVRWEAG